MSKFNITHICNDYSRQALYRNLFKSLSRFPINQYVYVPVRTQGEVGKYLDNSYNVFQRYILNFSDKIFFKRKINKLYKDFISCRVLLKADLIHAHFLYSDGALALKIKKKLNIKYIVAVRNTDINYFFKLRPDLYF